MILTPMALKALAAKGKEIDFSPFEDSRNTKDGYEMCMDFPTVRESQLEYLEWAVTQGNVRHIAKLAAPSHFPLVVQQTTPEIPERLIIEPKFGDLRKLLNIQSEKLVDVANSEDPDKSFLMIPMVVYNGVADTAIRISEEYEIEICPIRRLREIGVRVDLVDLNETSGEICFNIQTPVPLRIAKDTPVLILRIRD